MRLAVYGGSFNPLHLAHLRVMQRLSEHFDKVLLVVSPKNPLKDTIEFSSAQARLKAAKEALGRHSELAGKVEVSDIEFRLPSPSFTFRTLDTLKEEHPDYQDIFLAVGGDQFADFRRWKEYRHILRDFGLAVFPREGYDNGEIKAGLMAEDPSYRIELIEMELLNVSSTYIRDMMARGVDVSDLLM